MKCSALISALCLILLTGHVNYAQLPDQDFGNAWMVTHAENTIGMEINQDLPFYMLSFITDNKVALYLSFITDDRDKRTDAYEIRDSFLIIDDYYQQFKYRIIKKTESQTVLYKDEKYYYLRRVLRYEQGNFILADKNLPLTTGKTDTLKSIYSYKPALYKGDLYDFFVKNIPDEIRQDTASLIQLSFTLKPDGTMEDILIFPESYRQFVLNSLMPLMNDQWIPAERNDKKKDAHIILLIFVASKDMQSWRINQPLKLIQKLYNTGLAFITDNSSQEALASFAACEKLFDSYQSCEHYSRKKHNYIWDMQKYWINSMMNQASLYFREGQPDLSCAKWYKAAREDKEAYGNYKNNCKQE